MPFGSAPRSRRVEASLRSLVGAVRDTEVRARRALAASTARWSASSRAVGALLFDLLSNVGVHLFLEKLAGWSPARPGGEHSMFDVVTGHANLLLLALMPALGGLFSGALVTWLAPEASGHGTDAAIDAYHRHGGYIRPRVPLVKIVASALTLGSGGSGGREGPIAQIGAGFGSFIATRLRLSNDDRRMLVAAGMGAGIGSIFRAPLAGALFASEILYSSAEFEASVLIPACVSSIIAYSTFTLVHGTGTLFHTPPLTFTNPLELLAYFVLAVVLVVYGFALRAGLLRHASPLRALEVPGGAQAGRRRADHRRPRRRPALRHRERGRRCRSWPSATACCSTRSTRPRRSRWPPGCWP